MESLKNKKNLLWLLLLPLAAISIAPFHSSSSPSRSMPFFPDELGKAKEVPMESWNAFARRLDQLPSIKRFSFSSQAELSELVSCRKESIQKRLISGGSFSEKAAVEVRFQTSLCVRFPAAPSAFFTLRTSFFPKDPGAPNPLLLVYEFSPHNRDLKNHVKNLSSAMSASAPHWRMTHRGSREVEVVLQTKPNTDELYLEFYWTGEKPLTLLLDDLELYSPGNSASFERYGFDYYSEMTPRERRFRKVWVDSNDWLTTGLFAPPGRSLFRFPIRVTKDAVLTFAASAFSVFPLAKMRHSDVQISIQDGTKEERLYRSRLESGVVGKEERIDLHSFQGRSVDLVFQSQTDSDGPVTFWSRPRIFHDSKLYRDRRQNVILVTIDALRPDHLGAYGYPRPTSPTLDRIAREAFVFENAYTVHPTTFYAVASLVSSQYLFRSPTTPFPIRFSPSQQTIWEVFKKAGFDTFFHGQMEFYENLRKGLDAVHIGYVSGQDEFTVAEFLHWLEGRGERPFFAWIHIVGPHILGPVGQKSKELFPLSKKVDVNRLIAKRGERCSPDCLKPERKKALIDFYDAKVRTADNLMAQILATLGKLGLGERTALVITSDHGENLMDEPHTDWMEHGLLTPSSLRVPLIILSPKNPGVGRIDPLVSHIDLAPTLLDLAGLKPLPSFQGRSFLPLLNGEKGFARRFVRFQGSCADERGPLGMFDGRYAYLWNPTNCVLDYPYGIRIRSQGDLYDWASPQWFLHELSSREPELAKAFQRTIGQLEGDEIHLSAGELTTDAGLDLLEQAGYLVPKKK